MNQMTKNVWGRVPCLPARPSHKAVWLEQFVPMYVSLIIICLFMFISLDLRALYVVE